MNNLPEVQNGANFHQRSNAKSKRSTNFNSKCLNYMLFIIFFFLTLYFNNNGKGCFQTMVVVLSFLMICQLLKEVMFRSTLIYEEYKRNFSIRYNNSMRCLLENVFNFYSISQFLGQVVIAMIGLIFDSNMVLTWYNMGPFSCIFSLFSFSFLKRIHNIENGPVYDSMRIKSSNGLDYGSGMAHSFFHGYLKLVIRNTGTEETYLSELFKDYEDTHHIKIKCHKLFILIPKSLNCPPTLKDDRIPSSIEESSSLKEKKITIAGVQNRIYKNSVYKIKDGNDRVYVCAEYATPLKTFKDVVSNNNIHSEYYQRHKHDILLQFYLTLDKILKASDECKDYCELIYYDDVDANGHFKDVGTILLKRIRKLTNQR